MKIPDNPSGLTRARAFDYLGRNHHIPALRATNWLGDDLTSELIRLGLGQEVILDYGGVIPNAPCLQLTRSADDVISLTSMTGALDSLGDTPRNWPSTELPGRLDSITYDILGILVHWRRAGSVILIPPQ